MKLSTLGRLLLFAAAIGTAVSNLVPSVQATPYASCITNGNNTVGFYLNESGGNVTVKYEDNSLNPSFNGTTTGTNLPSGPYNFSLAGHTSYTISVAKVGTGAAAVVHTLGYGTPRGIDVNKNPSSPYFGNVYVSTASASAPTNALRRLNSDLSGISTNSGGIAWINSASEPYRICVGEDDYLVIGSFASAHSGVYYVSPDLTTGQTLLGPPGDTAGIAAGSHASEISRCLLLGNLQSGNPCTLFTVDAGNITGVNSSQLNSLLVYSNITLSTLPRITAPDLLGPEITLNQSLQNNYPGVSAGPPNQSPTRYIYVSNRRDGPSGGSADVQIYALTNLVANTAGGGGPGVNLANPTAVGCVWASYYNGIVNDYFAVNNTGPADSAVSPDGKYFAAEGYGNNQIIVCSLTNGIPDVSTLYVITNSISQTSAGRGLCWDAADNIYLSSSGGATFQEWSLGFTATTVTTGNATGPTGFSVVLPSTTVGVVASPATISQSGLHGDPTSGTFTITRTGNVNSPLVVPFTLGGSAASGSYTASKTTGVTIAAGQSSTNITITAIADGISRPTTTITLTLATSGSYTLAPGSATMNYLNTGPEELVASVAVPTMYNAFSNDFASFTITRWGDTNVPAFTCNTFSYGGSATVTQDYTTPTPVTFNPGDVSQTSVIQPLYNGALPIQTTAHAYVGPKNVSISIANGTGYFGSTSNALMTILDQAYPTATVLWSDPLTNAADAGNWTTTAANNDMQNVPIETTITGTSDNSVIFGYDLLNGDPVNLGAIPLPPSGAATALRVTANKGGGGRAAGVNLYPNGQSFSGNYAVRFSMNIIQGFNNTVSTEGPLMGINHSGIATNWFANSALISGWGAAPGTNVWDADGIWYWINADNDNGGGAYLEYTGLGGALPNTGWTLLASRTAGTFSGSFKSNDFSGGVYWFAGTAYIGGLVSGESILNGSPYTNNNWADVEIKQFNNVVTLSIDKTPVFVYTNTTTFTNGTLMLGYNDPFSSVGAPDAAVYYSNLKVVQLTPPVFSGSTPVVVAGGNVTLTFSSPDATATFLLQSASNLNGPWTDVSPQPIIVSLGGGNYQFTTAKNGSQQFYRIRYK